MRSPRASRVGRAPSAAGEVGARREQLAVSVWLRMLKAHGLLIRETRRRVPAGMTLPQFDVLAQLARRPEGMTPGALTRELLVSPGNVTGIVDRLARKGWVERRPVPGDRRAVRLVLTPRGRASVERAVPRHRKEVAALLTDYSDRELRSLRELLGRLSRRAETEDAA